MLTKKEREEIVERCKRYFYNGETDICRYLLGHSLLDGATDAERYVAILNCIRELCDTSNMIELPCDKNGEIIYFGDEVYNEAGDRLVAKGFSYREDGTIYIRTFDSLHNVSDPYFPCELTHEYKNKYKQLAEKLEAIVDKDITDGIVASHFFEIIDELRELGDDNDGA